MHYGNSVYFIQLRTYHLFIVEATLHEVSNIIRIRSPLLHDRNVEGLQPLLGDKDVVLLKTEAGAGLASVSVRVTVRINVHHGGGHNLCSR